MILYYLILGVALAMSIATWALVRWCNQLVQLNEQTALQNANLWRVREDLLRQRGQIERASRHWFDLFHAERRNTHAQSVEIAELQQQLEQHQAAAGYRKSGSGLTRRRGDAAENQRPDVTPLSVQDDADLADRWIRFLNMCVTGSPEGGRD